MKNITLVLDGVADRPNGALGGKTPLEYANTPNLDRLSAKAELGCVKTIPDGLEVGSAVANMSLLGLDPRKYRGRAVIEAAGAGLNINPQNLYIRANYVQFEGETYESSSIKSYSAGDIPTEFALDITHDLNKLVLDPPFELHNVGSFRNILEVAGARALYPLNFAPAHDIIGQPIANYLHGELEQPFFHLQREAYRFLFGSRFDGYGIWLWGASITPDFPAVTGNRCVFAETILMRGITALSGIKNFPTDENKPFGEFLIAKAKAAAAAINGIYDSVYIHIQAPDDLSHELKPVEKARAVETIDSVFLPELLDALNDDYTLVIASDHFTFSDTGSHGAMPAPFMLYRSNREQKGGPFTERSCAEASLTLDAPGLLERAFIRQA